MSQAIKLTISNNNALPAASPSTAKKAETPSKIKHIIAKVLILLETIYLHILYFLAKCDASFDVFYRKWIFRDQLEVATSNFGRRADIPHYLQPALAPNLPKIASQFGIACSKTKLHLDPFGDGLCHGGCLLMASKCLSEPSRTYTDIARDCFEGGVAYEASYLQSAYQTIWDQGEENFSIDQAACKVASLKIVSSRATTAAQFSKSQEQGIFLTTLPIYSFFGTVIGHHGILALQRGLGTYFLDLNYGFGLDEGEKGALGERLYKAYLGSSRMDKNLLRVYKLELA